MCKVPTSFLILTFLHQYKQTVNRGSADKEMTYLLADVLSAQHSPAGFTLEAAEVPLASERHQSLAVLDVSPAARTV